MKRDTRNEILRTAKKLFNEQGYHVVSLRDISAELGISKGNLTYYFSKKEEIAEALLLENHEPDRQYLKPPETLAELDAFFLHSQEVVKKNAFYFWHHAQLSQLSPKIKEQQSKAYERNFAILKQAFLRFKNDGIFREEDFPGEYDALIDSLHLASIYWIPFRSLKQQPGKHDFQSHAWAAIHPFLTESGKEILHKQIHAGIRMTDTGSHHPRVANSK